MQFNAYIALLLAAGLLSGIVAGYAWRRRRVPAAAELAILLLAAAEWSLSIALEAASTTMQGKLFWSFVAYLGTMSSPVLLYLFALRYSQQDRWLKPRRAAPLWIIPLLSVSMAATNPWHHLLWSSVTLTQTWAGVIAVYGHGPWFWIELVYSYILVGLGMLAIGRSILHLQPLYFRQTQVLLVALVVPWLGNVLYAVVPTTLAGIDPTPLAFALTSLLFALAIFRYRLLDLRPIARDVLVDRMDDMIFVLDNRLRLVDLNPAAQSILGAPSGKLLGQQAEQALGQWPGLIERLQRTEDGRQEVDLVQEGAQRHYSARLTPLRDARNVLVGYLLTLRDITERKRAEEERLTMERRLLHLQKIETLGALAGGVAHDYNNLLASAVGTLEMILPDVAQDPTLYADIQSVTKTLWRAADLTHQLMTYAGRAQLAPRSTDLSELITKSVGLLQTTLGPNVDLQIRLGVGLPPIMADQGQIQQITLNLITNAAEAIGEHQGILVLSTGSQWCDDALLSLSRLEAKPPVGEYVYLRVADSGSGMSEETQRRLFEPFFTTRFLGRGLGMAATLGIVREHRGAILVESKLGRGTIVTVLFPALSLTRSAAGQVAEQAAC